MANGLFNLKQVMQGIQQGGWNGQKPPAVEYLVVAGGGGGTGSSGSTNGGGGGAGGLLAGIDPVPNGQTLLVTIGTGGAGGGSATSGTSSVFGSISASGGGFGGLNGASGTSGGSGGGGYSGTTAGPAGQGIVNQGNAGGIGFAGANYGAGGGGGAGTVGLAGTSGGGGNGGSGVASAISGTVTTYAGGGGGSFNGTNVGAGGVGGGGAGGNNSGSTPGGNGTANTGGGGGGYGTTGSGGNGGSGIVIVSYPDVYAAPTSTTGSPTVSTSGSGSISNSGANNQGWRYSGQSAFAFGTGDFTIELWVYLNSLASYPTFFDFRDSAGSGNGINAYIDSGASNVLMFYANGGNRITGASLSTGQWYHIAIARSGTTTKMFLNGTQTGSTYTDTTNYVVGATSPTFMVNAPQSAGGVNGYLSNLRIVKGTAVYTANFTAPTAPLTPISGTSLLMNTASGAYFADSSTNSFTPTITGTGGNPVWNSASPFATGAGYKNRVYTWTSSGSITF